MLILPVILIMIFSVCVSFFSSEKGEYEENFEKNAVDIFKEENDYSMYFLPLVINDFFSYEKGEEINNETLASIGVWSIISSEDMQKYEAFDGELVIPSGRVEERIKELFSDEILFENTSVESENFEIIYEKDSQSYTVPTLGYSPNYSAVLQSVISKSDETVLIVGCLESESFKQDSSGKTVLPEAEKIIEIVLKKENGKFCIHKVSEEIF